MFAKQRWAMLSIAGREELFCIEQGSPNMTREAIVSIMKK